MDMGFHPGQVFQTEVSYWKRFFYCNFRWREASTQVKLHSEDPDCRILQRGSSILKFQIGRGDSTQGKLHSGISNRGGWGGPLRESFTLKSQVGGRF
jgi:hypothetical protein